MLRYSRQQRGLGLVELMVSLTIGMFLLVGLLAYLARALSTTSSTYQNSRISQELNAVMELMARDIRRAGYSSTAYNATTPALAAANAFTQSAVAGANDGGINLATAGCILYSYDMPGTANGTRDSGELLGFKLQDGAVYTASSGSGSGCNASGWQPITDPKVTEITTLTFQYLDASDNVASPQKPFVSASGSGWSLCTRNIRVTVSGRLVSDPTIAIRSHSQDVRVRNDWYNATGSSC
jgi:prepilin peptidase dependent protein B